MKQAGSTRLCVLVFKMILVLKELCTFHIGVKDMKNLWKRRIKRDKCLRNACQ